MPHTITDADRDQIRKLHAKGLGRNQIAAVIGCSVGTVTKHARQLGLFFDRAATAQAVEARVVDLKARRAAIIARLYTRTEKNLDRLEHDGYTYSVVLPGGAEDAAHIVEHTDQDPPSADERNHMSAIAGYLAAAAKLELADADGGASDARAMLAKLGEALRVTQP